MSRGEIDVLERQLEARDPDVRLMLQVRNDTPAAFEALVQRYQDRLVGILYYLVGNLEEAEVSRRRMFFCVSTSRARVIGHGQNSQHGCSQLLTILH